MNNRFDGPGKRRSTDPLSIADALRRPGSVLLESARTDVQNHRTLLFRDPIDILSPHSPSVVPSVFDTLERYLSQGKYIAGYVSYECGRAFEVACADLSTKPDGPLLWFGVYDAPESISPDALESLRGDPAGIDDPRLLISFSEYAKKLETIKDLIARGDTYQVNYTDRMAFSFEGDAVSLYLGLREKQRVPYAAFIRTDDREILSFSPELFFRREGDAIITRPMKGTSARGRSVEEDSRLAAWLRSDEKNRSENLMIVDLLRNDLGRLCRSGSVRVDSLFEIEKYESVLQMTSTVSGTLRPGIRYEEIFRSLFPSGSVTGAPKIRTMHIIDELERFPRGVYCGAIGYIAPGAEAVFNVAIRTVVVDGGSGTMGIGSGIVFDSDAAAEYRECAVKAEFLTRPSIDHQLLETLLWNDEYTFLIAHLKRLRDSADYFLFHYDESEILRSLKEAERHFTAGKKYRIRLLLSRDGSVTIERFPLTDTRRPVIRLAAERTDSSDRYLYHKTTHRSLYDRYAALAQNEAIADYIFLNERNEVTEGSISNIFLSIGGRIVTPPVEAGLLNGIFRAHLLATTPTAEERTVTLDDLHTADEIFIGNSVRGMRKVTWEIV